MRLRRPNIFYGWYIVLVSLIADGMKHGSFNRGFTVLYVPIEHSIIFPKDVLGFSPQSRTMLGLAEGLGRFMGGVQGPLMGYCTDRFGPRVMLAFGGLMSGLGFILLARTTNFWWFLLVFVVFLSVGFRSDTTTHPLRPLTTGSAGGAGWRCPWSAWATGWAAHRRTWWDC